MKSFHLPGRKTIFDHSLNAYTIDYSSPAVMKNGNKNGRGKQRQVKPFVTKVKPLAKPLVEKLKSSTALAPFAGNCAVKVSGIPRSLDGLSKTERTKYVQYLSKHFENPTEELLALCEGSDNDVKLEASLRFNDNRVDELLGAVCLDVADVDVVVNVGDGNGAMNHEFAKFFDCTLYTVNQELMDSKEPCDVLKFPAYEYDRPIDVLILSHVLHHVPYEEQIAMLRELSEHMSEYGVIIFKDHDVQINQHTARISFIHSIWNSKPEYPCGDILYLRSALSWHALMVDMFPKFKPLNSRKAHGFGRTFITAFGQPSAKRKVKSMKVLVQSDAILKEVLDKGFSVKRVQGQNPHERAAATRTQLLITGFAALEKLYPKKTKIALLSDWGRIENFLAGGTHQWDVRVSQQKFTARDYVRTAAPREENLRECMVGIIHDQYDGLTPEHMDAYFNLLAPDAVIFVFLTPMFGKAGVLSDMVYYDDGTLVTCSADESQSYFHSSKDFPRWLNEKPVPVKDKVLHSMVFRQFNEKCIFQVARLPQDVPQYAAGLHYPSMLEEHVIPVATKRWNWWTMSNKIMEDKVTLFVYPVIFERFTSQYRRSKTNPWNIATLTNTVNDAFGNDAKWKCFALRFPGIASRTEAETADAIMYSCKEASIVRLESLAAYAAPFEERHSKVMKGKGPTVYVSWLYKFFRRLVFGEEFINGSFVPNNGSLSPVKLFAAFVALFLFRKLFGKSFTRLFGAMKTGCMLPDRGPLVLPSLPAMTKVSLPTGIMETAGPNSFEQRSTLTYFLPWVAKCLGMGIALNYKTWKAIFTARYKTYRELPLEYLKHLGTLVVPEDMRDSVQNVIVATLAINPLWIAFEHRVFRNRRWLSIAIHVLLRTDLGVPWRVLAGMVGATSYWTHLAWNVTMTLGLEFGAVVMLLKSFLPTGCVVPPNAWRSFSSRYNAEEYKDALEVVGSSEIPIGERLLSTRAHPTLHMKVTPEPQHTLVVKHHGIKSTFMPEDPRVELITPVLLVNSVLYAPTPGLNSLYCALRCRNMQEVPEPAPLPVWSSVLDQMAELWPHVSEGVDFADLIEWANHYGDRRKRELALDLIQRIDNGEMPYDWHGEKLGSLLAHPFVKLGMFAKFNESINLRFWGGFFGVKPRTIITLPLVYQIHIQPWLRRAATIFKKNLLNPFTVDGVDYWFTYAGGMNSADLDNWYLQALSFAKKGGVSGIFMGDDSLLIDGRYDCLIIECDYSHFDQSQSMHLIEFDGLALRKLGVPASVVEALCRVAGSRSKSKRISLHRNTEVIFTPGFGRRCSGSPNTALSNSVNNMVAMVIAGEKRYSSEIFDFIGFKTKLQTHTLIRKATFLKGKWWLSSSGSYNWATLPSRVMKLGKVGCVLKDQRDVSVMAFAIAQNLGEVHEDFPILGAFRSALVRLSDGDQFERMQEPKFYFGYAEHRIRNQMFTIDRDEALIDVMARYDITKEDICEMEDLFKGVVKLPWYVGHEAFVRLRYDYL